MQTNTPAKLLNVDANPKTIKNHKHGYLTAVLYLAPADLASTPERPINVCPMAELAQCKDPCLNTAGRGAFDATQQARIRKTQYLFDNPDAFMLQLAKEIEALAKRAHKLNLKPLVRLNGTSDIKWENVQFEYEFANNKTRTTTIFQLFPEVQFYDYTKLPNRKPPANYDLTFSHSGVPAFQKQTNRAIFRGMRVAVVFESKPLVQDKMRVGFLGLPVVDGDDTDVRHIDPQKSVVALYAKGRAKRDTSGFVVRS
jgi:hypothetical protein